MKTVTQFPAYTDFRQRLRKLYTDINFAQTLDRSYHLDLAETTARDEDQILSKGEFSDVEPSLLMVPQLWLWVIDERMATGVTFASTTDIQLGTIISTCPERFDSKYRANMALFDVLKGEFEKAHSQAREHISPEDMVALILRGCLGFFSQLSKCGLSRPAPELFASYIARQVNSRIACIRVDVVGPDEMQSAVEVLLREEFRLSLEARHASSVSVKLRTHKRDIAHEVDCLQEVKDVRDEVNMIQAILKSQQEVFDTASRIIDRDPVGFDVYCNMANSPRRYLKWDQTLSHLVDGWKRLDGDAARVEQSV